MLLKKEFFFVRHGQTDVNLSPIRQDSGDIPLNATGHEQARSIAPIISALPIKTICCSPMQRAQQTKQLACSDLAANHAEIKDLSECNTAIWFQMSAMGKDARSSAAEPTSGFMQKVLRGMNQALSHEGPVLIVAHGGVHWAACCFMDIEEHDWLIGNCIVTHFTITKDGRWKAKKLNSFSN